MLNGIVPVTVVLAFCTMISSRPQGPAYPVRPWSLSHHSIQSRRSISENNRSYYARNIGDSTSNRRVSFTEQNTPGNNTEREKALRTKKENKSRRTENGTSKILTGRLSARGTEESDIVFFPGPAGDTIKVPNAPSKPPCGAGKTFCESTDNYPSNYIEGILRNGENDFQDLLGVDELQSVEIGQRIDYVPEFELCRSTEQVVFPKSARNKDDQWLFVVNQPSYMQGVRVELCQGENERCELSENFPNGYNSSCQQKYIYRKMLALGKNGTTVTDLFKLPSCCSCVVSNPQGIASRSGFSPSKGETTSKKQS